MRPRAGMSKRVSKVTIDHDEIQRWAEERDGEPAVVRGTTIIRLDFPGFAGPPKLQRMSWDDWFRLFDEQNLALVYEERTARGIESNFNKLVGRETVDLETGEQIAPPRRRAKQGARTVREARQIRRAQPRTTRSARAKVTRAKKPAKAARRGTRQRASRA